MAAVGWRRAFPLLLESCPEASAPLSRPIALGSSAAARPQNGFIRNCDCLASVLSDRAPGPADFSFVSLFIPTDANLSFFTAENQWLHLSLITQLKKDCKEIFPVVEYAYTTIPTYPSGQIGFMVCCKDASRDVKVPVRSFSAKEEEEKCRYYNSEIHKASFVLPNFAKKALQ